MITRDEVVKQIQDLIEGSTDPLQDLEALRDALFAVSPQRGQPVDRVRWVPVEDVQPNDYNPNAVARKEMSLLYVSIREDGYTQPVVTVRDPETGKYVIVDGFHRYYVCATQRDIRERNHGLLPVVVLDKDINHRMAATIRHNRARGEHSISGMSNLVFNMLDNGWGDADICNEIGLEPEELLKLKHVTGFSKLFQDTEYSKAWESRNMVRARVAFERKQQAAKKA